MPPLRERRSDIPLLVQHFLEKHNRKRAGRPAAITEEAMVHLWEYDWPGNVRELENLLERLVILSEDGHIARRAPAAEHPLLHLREEDPAPDARRGRPRPEHRRRGVREPADRGGAAPHQGQQAGGRPPPRPQAHHAGRQAPPPQGRATPTTTSTEATGMTVAARPSPHPGRRRRPDVAATSPPGCSRARATTTARPRAAEPSASRIAAQRARRPDPARRHDAGHGRLRGLRRAPRRRPRTSRSSCSPPRTTSTRASRACTTA